MKQKNIVIVSNKKWGVKPDSLYPLKKKINIFFISDKSDLRYEKLDEIKPDYIFFTHWSYKIPEKIYFDFECIVFHMTDLPYGRGGTPLQNLISEGKNETKITAFKCNDIIDGGPIYLKKKLSLYGGAEEIYIRASKIISKMIIEIIEGKIIPKIQVGEIVNFARKKPADSNLKDMENIEDLFNKIRMLDAHGYPKAFLNIGSIQLEFSRVSRKTDHLMADVKITERKNKISGNQ